MKKKETNPTIIIKIYVIKKKLCNKKYVRYRMRSSTVSQAEEYTRILVCVFSNSLHLPWNVL